MTIVQEADTSISAEIAVSLGARAQRVNLTRVDLARRTGLNRQTVARVLAGSETVEVGSVKRVLAEILAAETRLAELLGVAGIAFPRSQSSSGRSVRKTVPACTAVPSPLDRPAVAADRPASPSRAGRFRVRCRSCGASHDMQAGFVIGACPLCEAGTEDLIARVEG